MTYSEISSSIAHFPDCQLLAVSKLQPVEKIRELYQLGQRDFAENYVQEFLLKREQLADLNDIRWHFIGHLQKNKVKFLLGLVHMIHSVDSLALAEYIDQKIAQSGSSIAQKILLQINLSGEDTKGGFSADNFSAALPTLRSLGHLQICGLMTMPPLVNSGDENRKYFRQLKNLLSEMQQTFPQAHELSMGTSHDYAVAAEEGATWVRLGTVLFGERPK